ncbi:protein sprint [Neocloeon triangulifer]|uniref:protein sprint n=1 Tax=Neocloeon triangulifer TaxID=2078957 RepID=UPI00286F3BAA|nr:protein sprint [Neocloeon triangulifer]
MRPRSESALTLLEQRDDSPERHHSVGHQPRPSSYLVLLNSLASDLDLMLSDLCTTPPPPDDAESRQPLLGRDLNESEGSLEDVRGDAFLEPYMQGLGPARESPLLRLDADTDYDDDENNRPPSPVEAPVAAPRMLHASSPPHATLLLHETQPATLITESNGVASKFKMIDLTHRDSDVTVATTFSTQSVSVPRGMTSEDEGDDEGEEDDEDSCGQASSSGGGSMAPCDIGLVERLIRSHPVWFLAGLQRAGAVHLLQGKEEGNFVVRQSSQADTMAISVRLPAGKGPYIEHYLVQATSTGQLALESSENKFDDIPTLVAHYAQCCDELPVQLTLPRAIREARNRQQLSSLALLGQEFWRYPMANPRPERGTPGAEVPLTAPLTAPPSLRLSPPITAASEDEPPVKQQTPNSSQSSLCSFGSGSCSINNLSNSNLNNLLNNNNGSASSSPPKDNIVLNLAPFKEPSPPSTSIIPQKAARPNSLNLLQSNLSSATNSPLSPNASTPTTKSNPPKPPPRWAKPSQNFSVTTSVTFQVSSSITTTTPKIEELRSEGLTSPQQTLHPGLICSPTESKAATPTTGHSSRRSKRKVSSNKESYHYQESDILESPTVYYRSSVADKISDYEDIWGPSPPEHKIKSPQQAPSITPELLTFKPRIPQSVSANELSGDDRRPDLLGSCASLMGKNNLVSPVTSPVSPLILESPISSPLDEEGNKPSGSPFYAEPADAIKFSVQRRKPRPAGVVPQHRQRVLASHRHSDPTIQHTWWPPPQINGRQHQPLERIESSEEIHAAASVDNITMLRSPTSTASTPMSAVSHQHPLITSSSNPLTPNLMGPVKILSGVSESHLAAIKSRQQPKAKPVQVPRVLGKAKGISRGDGSWAVDSSWEFFGSQAGSPASEGVDEPVSNRFPPLNFDEDYEEDDVVTHLDSDGKLRRRLLKRPLTAQELIAEKCPELGIPPDISIPGIVSPGINDNPIVRENSTHSNNSDSCRMSAYDNVEGLMNHGPYSSRSSNSQASDEDAHTVFSEPWDSSRWETLLLQKSQQQQMRDEDRLSSHNGTPGGASTNSSLVHLSGDPLIPDEEDMTQNRSAMECKLPHLSRTKSFKDRMDPLLSPPRLQALRARDGGSTGATIRAYALQLAADKSTTFAQNIENFIQCTRESKERSPHVAMRNMRQFMSGMKNYLVKHGERNFEKEVEKERNKLKANEFLNLDAILEGVMHKLVVRPLREHLYRLFVAEYSRTGAIQLLASNIQYARTKPPHDLGIRAKISPPSEQSLHTICHYLTRLQQVDSPLEKLENLLACISTIFNSVKSSNQNRGGVLLGADDFLPLFVWVLVRGGMVAAEIEAEFMWGLLQPSLLSGEGGYYLTTLSSAVHVLKNFRACYETQNPSLDWRGGSLAELRSVLRIVVPDELHGSILTKTLPVRPNTTTRDVCKIIAHKIRITNPQDYGLYKLVDGEETLLNDGECPQDVKDIVSQDGRHCVFAYKRIDAKIAWPRTSPSPSST